MSHEVVIAQKVSDLTPVENKFHQVGLRLEESLGTLGITDMSIVFGETAKLHSKVKLAETTTPDGQPAFTPKIEIEMDDRDKEGLWELHKQLQAGAVMAFGLWQNPSFKVYVGTMVTFDGPFKGTMEDRYAVLQRGNMSDTQYMKLFFSYLQIAQQIRGVYLKNIK